MTTILKKLGIGIMMTIVMGTNLISTEAAVVSKNGEQELNVLVAEHVDSKVLYSGQDGREWVWHGDMGYPLGKFFTAVVNGQDLPKKATEKNQIKVNPTDSEMEAIVQERLAIKKYANKLVLFATTGASAAKTEIGIVKATLVGRLLNVQVGIANAPLNQPLTMNLIYPESVVSISKKNLPSYGDLHIRFVDLNGEVLATKVVNMGI